MQEQLRAKMMAENEKRRKENEAIAAKKQRSQPKDESIKKRNK